MDQPEMGKRQGKPRILVAPLDWGLGHATRCIPIIRELLEQDCEVILAGEGAQEKLLVLEFPDLQFVSLEGYRVNYARSGAGLLKKIFFQLPGIRAVIKMENRWLKKMITKYSLDAVISDNRYGLYSNLVPCIFITHQLTIKSPWGGWTEKMLRKINYKYINRFTSCWIPDSEKENVLAGELSHPPILPSTPVHYIGNLSRFEPVAVPVIKDHLLILLSGPEPQRTILENKLVRDIVHYPGTATVIRGLPASTSLIPSTNMIKFYNHLPAKDLNREFGEAEFVIGRCGYSTVMDLVRMEKKSILIPTPGQTEQEYLSRFLANKKYAFCVEQKEFSILTDVKKAKEFSYELPQTNAGEIKRVITSFLGKL